ncbi:hypothetical protein CXB51_024227 [Gossypium anomalum]|uniref:Uncharacterized protein n=1 Tax=Gossypium anomalum TaxID=47600 RepID=A0A8J6CTJ9_9ROSI|nr:hypothetical protein CXB51_024227 [Gossypium anomalum]
MVGIPLMIDLRMSPSSNFKSTSVEPSDIMEQSKDPVPFLPHNLSFQEILLTGAVSTTMFSAAFSPTSLNLTFLVLRSSLEPSLE